MKPIVLKMRLSLKFWAAFFLVLGLAAAAPARLPAEDGDEDMSPGDSPAAAIPEIEEIDAYKEGYLDEYGANRPLDLLTEPLDALYESIGLRLRLAATTLFMEPLGVPDAGPGIGGDYDLMSSWTLVGRGTKDTGTLVTTAEYRHDIGPRSPADLRGEMGTLIAPANAFNDRGFVVRDFYWMQRLLDARLRILLGRGDPSDFFSTHWLQNVNNSFVNRNFSASPSVAFPGHGPFGMVSVVPNDEYYFTVGAANAYSRTTRTEVDSLFEEGDLFSFAEFGLTPNFEGWGDGRFAAGFWHMAAREKDDLPSDQGITLIADQELTPASQIFARYGYSDATLTNVRQLIQAGFGFRQLFSGASDTLSGVAASLAIPRLDSTRNETTVELFHRFQLTKNSQLTFGAQSIFDPGNNPDDDVVGVVYSRFRLAF